MDLGWIHENPPRWDESKQAIIGGAPQGIFDLGKPELGQLISGDWWRVEEGGRVAGYGWMDAVWGDAEILLAVDPKSRGRGVGSFILQQLEREAAHCGLRYMYNVVRPTHPQRREVTRWLEAHGFRRSVDDDRLTRKVDPFTR